MINAWLLIITMTYEMSHSITVIEFHGKTACEDAAILWQTENSRGNAICVPKVKR